MLVGHVECRALDMITPVEKRGRRRKQARAKSQRDKRMFFMMAEAPPYVDEIMKVIKSNKNPSQRLSKFFKFKNDKLIAAYVTFLLEIAREAEPDKDWCESNFTLENKDVYGLHAVAA